MAWRGGAAAEEAGDALDAEVGNSASDGFEEGLGFKEAFDDDEATAQPGRGSEGTRLRDADAQARAVEVQRFPGEGEDFRYAVAVEAEGEAAAVGEGELAPVEVKSARGGTLRARFAATGRLIDQIVYRLYGLSDEEIAIVEEGAGQGGSA